MSWWYDDGNIVKKVWQTDRRTDGQTDRRTENTIHRAAWSQLKIMKWMQLGLTKNKIINCKSWLLHCININFIAAFSHILFNRYVCVSSCYSRISNWTYYLWTPLCQNCILNRGILQESSRFCNWLSLQYLLHCIHWLNTSLNKVGL